MKIRLAAPLQNDSVVDGTGIRTVIWTQGCGHACPGCHNPLTHDFAGGEEVDVDDIKREIDTLVGQTGITFSGGDPLYQLEAVTELAKYIKNSTDMDIWVYTGFSYEDVLKMPNSEEFLNCVDILVDGKFEMKNRTLDAPFRGSTNQRIIDVPRSLREKKAILKEDLMKKKDITTLYKKEEEIYI